MSDAIKSMKWSPQSPHPSKKLWDELETHLKYLPQVSNTAMEHSATRMKKYNNGKLKKIS